MKWRRTHIYQRRMITKRVEIITIMISISINHKGKYTALHIFFCLMIAFRSFMNYFVEGYAGDQFLRNLQFTKKNILIIWTLCINSQELVFIYWHVRQSFVNLKDNKITMLSILQPTYKQGYIKVTTFTCNKNLMLGYI